MLFGFIKDKEATSSKKISRALTDYLNEVDEQYMKAYNIRSTKGLQSYMTRDCLVKIGQSVFSAGTRYFGADKFRTTTWLLESAADTTMLICKNVLFDKVKVGGSLMMSVADDYTEYWEVDVSNSSKPLVLDIRKC